MSTPDLPAGGVPEGEITRLLHRWSVGEEGAFETLLPLVYDELHRIARGQRRRPGGGAGSPTWGTTDLVHEACLRFVRLDRRVYHHREHFYAVAARAMRQILLDRAKHRRRLERGGGVERSPLDPDQLRLDEQADFVLSLNQSLERLGRLSPRVVRVVECRFFGGLSEAETARVVGVDGRTVRRGLGQGAGMAGLDPRSASRERPLVASKIDDFGSADSPRDRRPGEVSMYRRSSSLSGPLGPSSLFVAFVLVALLASTVPAAPLLAQASDPSTGVALVGGRLVDGFGGRPLANSVILVDGDTIVAVGQEGLLEVPEGWRTISTEGMDLLPGLWENHAHLMINGHSDYQHWDSTYIDRFGDEIMPASAVQLLLAGVTTARDLGAPLEPSISVKRRIESGEIPGPRLFVSGPFLQHSVEDWEKPFRWAVEGEADARAKVRKLAEAGVDIIKLIDQDEMTLEEASAIVDEAHQHGLKVVAHSHRPGEIRRGLEIGVDNFEHTGLTTAPEYPEDVIRLLHERTATGRISGGPLFWTPTVEGLWQYDLAVDNPEHLDDDCWHRGLKADVIADIRQSIEKPGQLAYTQLTPLRKPTLKRKFQQLRESGVVLLVGTDSGIPMKFHCQSTWNELAIWVNEMGIPPMDAIRAATYWPSVLMEVSDQWGTVSAGKKADIIGVRGDVLRYINLLQRVDFVMKGGTVYRQDGRVVESALVSDPVM